MGREHAPHRHGVPVLFSLAAFFSIPLTPAQYASQHTAYHPTQPTQYPVPHCQRLQSYLMVHGYTAMANRWTDRRQRRKGNEKHPADQIRDDAWDEKGTERKPTSLTKAPRQKYERNGLRKPDESIQLVFCAFNWRRWFRPRDHGGARGATRSTNCHPESRKVQTRHVSRVRYLTTLITILTLETERRRVNGSASAFWRFGIQWNKNICEINGDSTNYSNFSYVVFHFNIRDPSMENGREEIKKRKIQAKIRSENATKKHAPKSTSAYLPDQYSSLPRGQIIRNQYLPNFVAFPHLVPQTPSTSYSPRRSQTLRIQAMSASPRSLSPLNRVFHKPDMMFLFLLVAARIRHTVRGTCICIWIPGLGSISWGPFMEFVGPFTLWLPWPAPRAKNQTKPPLHPPNAYCVVSKETQRTPNAEKQWQSTYPHHLGFPSNLARRVAIDSHSFNFDQRLQKSTDNSTTIGSTHMPLRWEGPPSACSLGEARRSWDEFRFHRNKHWGNLEPPSLLMPPFPCPVIFLGSFYWYQWYESPGIKVFGFFPVYRYHLATRLRRLSEFWGRRIVVQVFAHFGIRTKERLSFEPRHLHGCTRKVEFNERKAYTSWLVERRQPGVQMFIRTPYHRNKSRKRKHVHYHPDDGQLPFYSSHRILHFYSKRSRTEFHETATSLAYKWPTDSRLPPHPSGNLGPRRPDGRTST
ncbi:hypothetical protein CCUS01_17354 [Colletotrichum cuscutae]|uniref:Uncharacterized protein n=1 Tax=Colletotrichum cuscutae TaxID=1209917 RepID=A0AAI9V844_9PEZI|nr:hypothetical protein CCUS01_17354 [Colletotrichum cuscutae]